MQHKPFFLIHILIFLVFFNTSINADQLKLLPLKKPVKKDKKEIKKDETVKEIKTTTKLGIIIPKNKPKIVSKKIKAAEVKSKYFSKKKFRLAQKSIEAFEKGRWTEALSLAKKSKDKNIYNFVQWRHLLTRGNKASYYEYKTFIDANEDYPRIGRIRYLAEHKLSTDTVSPKKIMP